MRKAVLQFTVAVAVLLPLAESAAAPKSLPLVNVQVLAIVPETGMLTWSAYAGSATIPAHAAKAQHATRHPDILSPRSCTILPNPFMKKSANPLTHASGLAIS